MYSYDPRGMTWDSWCKYMNELFAPQQLGYVPEDQWMTWAKGMNGIGFFVGFGIPDPRGFNSWQEWAQALSGIINSEAG